MCSLEGLGGDGSTPEERLAQERHCSSHPGLVLGGLLQSQSPTALPSPCCLRLSCFVVYDAKGKTWQFILQMSTALVKAGYGEDAENICHGSSGCSGPGTLGNRRYPLHTIPVCPSFRESPASSHVESGNAATEWHGPLMSCQMSPPPSRPPQFLLLLLPVHLTG